MPTGVFANSVSQSNSGSVTNQNWNVNNGGFHTNQYGGCVVCQGSMMTITPFTTFNTNYRKPYRDYYYTPVYDETDIVGDFDDDGNAIGDGNLTIREIFCIINKITLVQIKIVLHLEQELH